MTKKERKNLDKRLSEMVDQKVSSTMEDVEENYSVLHNKLRKKASVAQLEELESRFFVTVIVVAIVLIASGILVVCSLNKLSDRILPLEITKDIESAEGNKSELKEMDKTSGDNKTNYETYLDLVFPSDEGKLYEPISNDIAFYSDPDCTNRILNVKFVSFYKNRQILDDYSGVYCYRMSNGEICYSRQSLLYDDFTESK